MPSNLDKYKGDLKRLIDFGKTLRRAMAVPTLDQLDDSELKLLGYSVKTEVAEFTGKEIFCFSYQRWYTEASAVVRQLIPDRIDEFEELYRGEGRRKNLSIKSFTIQDWLNGIRFQQDGFDLVTMRFHNQVEILSAAQGRFESMLFDIRQMLQADLFDSELDSARELTKHGFLRGAGAIAGVVLEKHLVQVAMSHALKTRKKDPTISDLNDLLKKGDVVDIPTWRQVQRLNDLRNLCDHNKDRDPSKEEVEELISGVEKISKSLF